MHYAGEMKTAQLPPIRVAALVREQIESALLNSETPSHFVEQAAIDAARRRKAQQDFVARGRSSLARALETGEFYSSEDVLSGMTSRLEKARVAAHVGAKNSKRRS
ncbi:YlcI/YnfO family protein [Variovorax sp. YR752]|uniref:YlcI/YnfO family protein n=2 Tax=unclassified Variovorax TaxID=663243 RepID=UPI0027BA32BE|nr:YlcI/YnfO family protein [Variovorax sp. YR752]